MCWNPVAIAGLRVSRQLRHPLSFIQTVFHGNGTLLKFPLTIYSLLTLHMIYIYSELNILCNNHRQNGRGIIVNYTWITRNRLNPRFIITKKYINHRLAKRYKYLRQITHVYSQVAMDRLFLFKIGMLYHLALPMASRDQISLIMPFPYIKSSII